MIGRLVYYLKVTPNERYQFPRKMGNVRIISKRSNRGSNFKRTHGNEADGVTSDSACKQTSYRLNSFVLCFVIKVDALKPSSLRIFHTESDRQ